MKPIIANQHCRLLVCLSLGFLGPGPDAAMSDSAPMQEATRLIEAFEEHGGEAFSKLESALGHSSPLVRRQATALLGRTGHAGTDGLNQAVRDRDAETRRIAVEGLAELGQDVELDEMMEADSFAYDDWIVQNLLDMYRPHDADDDELHAFIEPLIDLHHRTPSSAVQANVKRVLKRAVPFFNVDGWDGPVAGFRARSSRFHLQGDSEWCIDDRFGIRMEIPYVKDGPSRNRGFSWFGGQGAGTARTMQYPELSPDGAFRIEMWIKPDEQLQRRRTAYLLDKMAVAYDHPDPSTTCMRDYTLKLRRRGDGWHVVALLGYGREGGVDEYESRQSVMLHAGRWHHLAFSYDGAGHGRLYLNDRLIGVEHFPDRGAIAHGSRALYIGERGASSYHSFIGSIAQVRIRYLGE